MLHQGYSVFADEKDEFLSLTPLYLLCGLSFPLWMPANDTALLPLLSGVLTVGIGDAAASFVGSNWGKHKLNGSRKTMEGLIACITSQLVLIYILAAFGKNPFFHIKGRSNIMYSFHKAIYLVSCYKHVQRQNKKENIFRVVTKI